MSYVDWIVLVAFLCFIVLYGLWKGKRADGLTGFLLAGRDMRWHTIGLSIMATQASAITFLSTPGQAYTDGMRFLQFYFGLPLAMIILCVTFVPIYYKLKVYTAYEYLEKRFDLKTRTLTANLFLIQRGLAAGLTIYAPSVILSVILGWNISITVFLIGALVTVYTASGGARAVDLTNFHQMLVIFLGMAAAMATVIYLLPGDVSLIDAAHIAGRMDRLSIVDFSFDINNRYNFWSGIIGGLFVALAYFGTDQSQVQRYLTGQSIEQSRLGLILNGIVKVPMQFFILFLGLMVFVFYQFHTPPVFFNPVELKKLQRGETHEMYRELQTRHEAVSQERAEKVRGLLRAIELDDPAKIEQAEADLKYAQEQFQYTRGKAIELLRQKVPDADVNDTNYVFLYFVMTSMPAGLIGLIIAAVFAASMSSTASELNALATTSAVDIYKRLLKRESNEEHYVRFSKYATVFWGGFAILFAEYASQLGSLVEAVNILGSVFYGTILGVFLLAFYFKSVNGPSAFYSAIVAEMVVIYCFLFTKISFLWYNVVGCLITVFLACVIAYFTGGRKKGDALSASPSQVGS
jgi:solute:Na+ symporter, SSS family